MREERPGRAEAYDRIEEKYADWRSTQPPRPPSRRAYAAQNLLSEGMSKIVLTAIGVGTGVVLLILAGVAFWTAAWWGNIDRTGAATGYALTGFFLAIAGLGAILSTWNHMFRVLDPNRAQSAAHH